MVTRRDYKREQQLHFHLSSARTLGVSSTLFCRYQLHIALKVGMERCWQFREAIDSQTCFGINFAARFSTSSSLKTPKGTIIRYLCWLQHAERSSRKLRIILVELEKTYSQHLPRVSQGISQNTQTVSQMLNNWKARKKQCIFSARSALHTEPNFIFVPL